MMNVGREAGDQDMVVGIEKGQFLTLNTMYQVQFVMNALSKLRKDMGKDVSIGDLPLYDSNGESLGVIGYNYETKVYCYYPLGKVE